MTRLRLFSVVLGATIAVGGLLSAAQNGSQGAKNGSNHGNMPGRTARVENKEDDGERIFAKHCSRCHNAPEGFSPRIAGTITRHMRVRANLSAEEERALLRYFNP